MSLTVNVTFSGICLFMPKGQGITVLLPNTIEDRTSIDGHPMGAHEPRLCAPGPKCLPLSRTLLELPGVLERVDPSNLDGVVNLAEVVPKYGIDGRYVSDPPEPRLAARVELPGGRRADAGTTLTDWEVDGSAFGGETYGPGKLVWRMTWAYSVDQDARDPYVVNLDSGSSAPWPLVLTPDQGVVSFGLCNVPPGHNPCWEDHHHDTPGSEDPHFRWFYTLYEPSFAEDPQARKALPVPKEAPVGTARLLGNPFTCMMAQWWPPVAASARAASL